MSKELKKEDQLKEQIESMNSSLKLSLTNLRSLESIVGDSLSLIVAVSGGQDSCVLLHLLNSLKEELKLDLHVAHVHHGLREASDAEADFVEQLAKSYSLPFRLHSAQQLPKGKNVEAWARELRYRFLEQFRAEKKADFIVTAHHKDDQAETVLFRLFSARLATDAHAIAECNLERKLYRPLLNFKKSSLRTYSDLFNLEYVDDESNKDLKRTRNRIRHDLLPLLREKYNPNVIESLSLVAKRLSADEDYLWADSKRIIDSFENKYLAKDILKFPLALRWRLLKLIANEFVGEVSLKLGYKKLNELSKIIEKQSASFSSIDIGFGISFKIESSGEIKFSLQSITQTDKEDLAIDYLDVPGMSKRTYLDGTQAFLEANVLQIADEGTLENLQCSGSAEEKACAYFDASKIDISKLSLRERVDGDLVDVSNRGHRKLKKLFQESGLELSIRERLPLVLYEDSIIWVPGICQADFANITNNTSKVLYLNYWRETKLD